MIFRYTCNSCNRHVRRSTQVLMKEMGTIRRGALVSRCVSSDSLRRRNQEGIPAQIIFWEEMKIQTARDRKKKYVFVREISSQIWDNIEMNPCMHVCLKHPLRIDSSQIFISFGIVISSFCGCRVRVSKGGFHEIHARQTVCTTVNVCILVRIPSSKPEPRVCVNVLCELPSWRFTWSDFIPAISIPRSSFLSSPIPASMKDRVGRTVRLAARSDLSWRFQTWFRDFQSNPKSFTWIVNFAYSDGK